MKNILYSSHKLFQALMFLALFIGVGTPLRLQAQSSALYRVNAGGGGLSNSIGTFAADTYFSPVPGGTFANPVTIAGTSNGALYQTERIGYFGYAFPVSNGTYTVVLHFAELYWTQRGQRVFDVAAEGSKVLTRYDIVAKAGPLTATTETLLVSVSDGVLNLDFSSLPAAGGVDLAKVSAIEVLSGTSRPCQDLVAPVVTSPITYCQGSTSALLSTNVTLSTGASLRLYNVATGGTVLADFQPATTTVGSTTYYAAQFVDGCESPRVALTVAITASPIMPVVTSPVSYCQGASSALLSTSVTLSTGASLRLYSVATGGTAIADFQPATTTVGSTAYYAAQVVNGCESGRAALTVSVTASPAAPTVTTPVTYCQGSTSALLSTNVTLSTGASLRLYGVATGGTAITDFQPATTVLGNTTYYATQIIGGCESSRAPLTVSITTGLSAPTVTSPVTYCQGSTSGLLSTNVTLNTGASLRLYSVATGGTAIADFQPATTTVGSTTYYAAQIVSGCESARTPLTVSITSGLSAPTVVTPITYCQGSTSALLSTNVTLSAGASLRLYSVATGGTVLADFRPATTTLGTTTYYAAQVLNGCESGRAPLTVSITTGLSAPTVASPGYCRGTTAALLSTNVTLSTGASLRLYGVATGGTVLADFRPATTTVGSTTYYAAQIVSGCESERTPFTITINASPIVPVVTSPITYCQGSTSALLSTSVTLSTGGSLRLYSVATGGTAITDFRPATTVLGSTTYYAAQIIDGCESGRAALTVSVTASPAAPTVASPVTYCQGSTSALLSTNVTLSTGASLRLYSVATGGTAIADFRPATTTLGSTIYYAAQVLNGCESGRAALTVSITTGLSAPTVASPGYCRGTTAALLSTNVTLSTGASLRLYSVATGGTAIADFRPATTTLGSTTYYAAQIVSGCESGRTPLTVTITASPTALPLAPPAGVSSINIAAWGDSFTHAEYGVYPQTLGQLSGYNVYDLGIGGETSVQIKNRMLADTAKRNWPIIIWVGRNDSDKPLQVKASIATMVASLKHSNYLVLGICNGADEGMNSYGWSVCTSLNNDLASIYGNHYLDVRSFLVSQYNPSLPQDVADHNADIPPTSLRSDWLHPNTAGCAAVGNFVYANLSKLLNATYCQGATSNLLSKSVKMTPGATLRVYSSSTATTASNDLRPATTTLGTTTYYVSQLLNGCESPRRDITISVAASCPGLQSDSTFRAGSSVLATRQAPAGAEKSKLTVYPNPFSEQATIDFTLLETNAYSLELYDSKGALVKRITSGTAQAGTRYNYQIDSHDLPEGMYLVRLVAGTASKTIRLTVTK